MARPKKDRKIFKCAVPELFNPRGCCACGKIILLADEIEAIRLIDCEGNDQESAAIQMQVSRTTIQRIYKSARQKIANALLEGKKLIIEKGGDFQ